MLRDSFRIPTGGVAAQYVALVSFLDIRLCCGFQIKMYSLFAITFAGIIDWVL